jgi:M6 family metalloprotease-like protein
MRKVRFGALYTVVCMLMYGSAFGSGPPFPRIQQLIKEGKVKLPYPLMHRAEAEARGINAPLAMRAPGPNLLRQGQTALSSTHKALVLLVQFPDQPSSAPAVFFDSLMFGINGPSVRNYYSEISYGAFNMVTLQFPSSVGWLTMPHPYGYYVNGAQGFGTYPNNTQKLAEDAIAAAQPFVDFSKYDNNGDGYVDDLIIVHTGSGGEFTGSLDNIYSHAWHTSSPVSVNGVLASNYSIGPEYWASPGDLTIGTYVHSMCHSVFGLPDLYDYNFASDGLGYWSLMGWGLYNGPLQIGESPAHPDAWSRWQMGFLTPINVASNMSGVSIPAVNQSGVVYRLWTNGSAGQEYFLVENRRRVGYDAFLAGDGLLIYHVDETQTTNNNPWYPGHTAFGNYKVALDQADGLWQLEQGRGVADAGDPFPGSSGNTNFGDVTSPASGAYDGTQTHVAVTSISASAPTMTANFTVSAQSFNIVAQAGVHGSINPSGTVSVNFGGSQRFAFTPSAGYSVDSVIVDGIRNLDSLSGYTFTNVTANHTIRVTFKISVTQYTLTTGVVGNGGITKNPNLALYDSNSVVQLTPVPVTPGNHFISWSGAVTGNANPASLLMNGNKSVTATFAQDTLTITASAGGNGTITPSGGVTVTYGGSQTFTITPNGGYQVDSIIVDGVFAGTMASYTFNAVGANHIIRAVFRFAPSGPATGLLVRDDFSATATTNIAGRYKWVNFTNNETGLASVQIHTDSTISPYNTGGTTKFGGVAWDSLFTDTTQIALTVKQKGGNGTNSSFFIYFRMNNKDIYYCTWTIHQVQTR